jgi:SagB-type dehydrogenase family enzyme
VTADGVERYVPRTHSTEQHLTGDVRGKLRDAALGQSFVESAPATFVIAGVFARTERKYGPRAERYVWMEAGHAGQNLLLQAVALGLGSVPVGAFRDAEVAEALGLPRDHAPLYMFPVGVPAGR